MIIDDQSSRILPWALSSTIPPLAFTTEGFASQLKGTKLSEVTTYFYAFTKLEF